jgi:hypothetical protein
MALGSTQPLTETSKGRPARKADIRLDSIQHEEIQRRKNKEVRLKLVRMFILVTIFVIEVYYVVVCSRTDNLTQIYFCRINYIFSVSFRVE